MVIIDDARLLGGGVESIISIWFFGGEANYMDWQQSKTYIYQSYQRVPCP